MSNNINGDITAWFKEDQADEIKILSDGNFIRRAEEMFNEKIYN